MFVGFTGTRKGLTTQQIEKLHEILMRFYKKGSVFIHGDCIGADSMSHSIAQNIGYLIHKRPCNLSSQRAYCPGGIIKDEPMGPLERNKLIVADSEVMIACPAGLKEERRSGTWATVRNARYHKKPLYIIYPDGEVRRENES